MFEYIPQIKSHYEYLTPYILKARDNRWVDPYTSFNWNSIFSPIEESVWQDLRRFGQVPLYPQYPAGKYFLDFGNPKFKVALECDGKEWHLDKDKDAKRDIDLFKDGWHVFRITGAECYQITEHYDSRYDFDDHTRANILEQYYSGSEGLLKAIGIFYFGFKGYDFDIEFDLAYRCLMLHTSPAQYDELMQDREDRYYKLRTEYYDYIENLNNYHYGKEYDT